MGQHDPVRRQLASAAVDAESQLRDLVDHLPVPCQGYDTDGVVVFWNRASERLYGFSAAEAIGRSLADLIIPVPLRDQFRGVLAASRSLTTSGEFCPAGEIELMHKDGSPVPVHSTHTAICAEGQPPLLFCLDIDLAPRNRAAAEHQQLELQIRQTQKLESLGVLAGGIAHDFNNILMTVLGNADLLLDELPPDTKLHRLATEITGAARRAAELCQQMLAYAGRGQLQVRPVALNDVITEMRQMLDVSISKKAVVTIAACPDLPLVDADPTQLRQVVMNLIVNASESLGNAPGEIRLCTSAVQIGRFPPPEVTHLQENLAAGRYVRLEVCDTGCGMAPDAVDRIFDPFYTTKFTGRGLGLAAVLGIIRGHRGALAVSSVAGVGTTFAIYLPERQATADPVPEPAATATAARSFQRATVLLVDDEESVRTTAAHMLDRLGCVVLQARDGIEALSVLRAGQQRIDLVLLDLTMPNLDGDQTLVELRKLDPRIRVVLTSGFNEQDAFARIDRSGDTGFLHKPYRLASLRTVLNRFLPADHAIG